MTAVDGLVIDAGVAAMPLVACEVQTLPFR